MITKDIKPSPEARQLFNQMVLHAGEDGELDVECVLALSILRHRRGEDPAATQCMTELRSEGWIEHAPEGGWLVVQ